MIVGDEIVIACNYKTKALGIKIGTPVWEAKKILKGEGLFLLCDHSYYSIVSSNLMLYLEKNTLNVEPFSIDEAFCEITGLSEMYKLDLPSYIKKMQLDILKKVGIPVSIGVSNTRIKAKVFSKINKPFGYYISLSSFYDKELFLNLPISIVPFIGKKSQKELRYKAENIYEFISMGYKSIKKIFGKSGTDLWFELVGVNSYIVKKPVYSKSMSRGRSFNKNITSDKTFLYNQLVINFSYLYEELIEKGYELSRVSIFFRDKYFSTNYYHCDFSYLIDDRKFIFTKIKELFNINYNSSILYRSTGVVFGKLKKKSLLQYSLFDKTSISRECNLKLYKTINQINKKYNSYKISYGVYILDKPKPAKLGIRIREY